MSKLFGLLFISATFFACKNNTPSPKAGLYSNGLILGYEEDTRLISGFYNVENCGFYLCGKFAGKKTNLISWIPGDKSTEEFGVLEFISEDSWNLSFLKTYPDCIEQSLVEGQSMKLIQHNKQWTRISSTEKELSTLYTEPYENKSSDQTLKASSIIRVIEIQKEWLKIETDSSDYWLREKDVNDFPG